MNAGICRDLDRLIPCFRPRVDRLLSELAARGYRVQVWETYRSPERVKMLAANGHGSARSVHPYGVAVDIVEADKTPWTVNQAGLWEAEHEISLALGLVRVHRGGGWDQPHNQAIAAQYDLLVAKMHGRLSADAFNDWIAARMAPATI